jgi:DNA-binding response OmpR family regulator
MKPLLLLAEGDSELRDLYSSFLRQRAYDVAVAETGLDCLQQLRQASPDVLVLDLDLTWGGGDGILGWLREEHVGRAVPVILTATVVRPFSGAQAADPPVVGYLAKPFTLASLEDCVRAALAKKMESSSWAGARGRPEFYIG